MFEFHKKILLLYFIFSDNILPLEFVQKGLSDKSFINWLINSWNKSIDWLIPTSGRSKRRSALTAVISLKAIEEEQGNNVVVTPWRRLYVTTKIMQLLNLDYFTLTNLRQLLAKYMYWLTDWLIG